MGKIHLLPTNKHFDTILGLKEAILDYYENFKLPYERSDFNKNFFEPVDNTFEVLVNEKKEKVLIPDSSQYPYLYRGQQEDIIPCLPTMFRNNPTDLQIFIDRLRIVEFILLLDQHPVVKGFFKKYNYKIDYIGLAQHYGLRTHLLDLTNDIDIALFFALCHYDKESDCYKPDISDGIQNAFLYVIVPILFVDPTKETFLENKISVIGLQPFSRPGIQKGFSFSTKKYEKFNSFKYSFNYTKEDSVFYYQKFDKGEKLWIKDILAEKAKIITSKNKFSVTTFNKTWERYPIRGLSKNKVIKLIKYLNIFISTHNEISKFNDNEINEIINKWNNEQVNTIIYQIRRRFWHEIDENNKAIKRHEFRTLEMLKQIELLRLVGNRYGIEEYKQQQQRVNTNSFNRSFNNKGTGWQKVPGRFELSKSEIFLKREDCMINQNK